MHKSKKTQIYDVIYVLSVSPSFIDGQILTICCLWCD